MNAKSRRGLALLLALVMGVSALTSCTEQETTQNPKDTTDTDSVVLESENYSISPSELAVYEYQAALSGLTNQFWYYQYGLIQDTEGMTKLFSNAYDYAYYMLPKAMEQGTYKAQAYDLAHQHVVYCEGALAAGEDQKLKKDVEAEVDQYIIDLKETAKSLDLSLKEYLQTYVGKSVKENDVRSAMEKYSLGSKYAEIRSAEISDALTLQELTAHAEANKSVFYQTYYHSYKFNDPSLLDTLEKATSPEKLLIALTEHVLEQAYHQAYKTYVTDTSTEDPYGQDATRVKVRETLLSLIGIQNPETGEAYPNHFPGNDTDAYNQAALRVVENTFNQLNKELLRITELSALYTDLADPESYEKASISQKWLFVEGRREGDQCILAHPDGSYEWCIVSKVMALDEEMTRNVCYIKFTDEEAYTSKEKANAFLRAFLDNKSAEKFDELAVQLEIIDPNASTLHEYVTQKAMTNISVSLSSWLYEEGRTVGDADVIQAGDVHYVAYYAAENEANWCIQARNALTYVKLQAWFEETEKKINLQSHLDLPEVETQPHFSVDVRPIA